MPIGAFFRRVAKMTKKPIMSTDLNSTYEEDFKHQKHYHQPPTVHKNLVEHEMTTRDEKRDVYDDRDIDVNMEASRFIEQVRKEIGYGDQGLNVDMENDHGKRDVYDDQDIDVDMEADRFIKQVRQKIGMTTKDGEKDSCDDQINLDMEIDRLIKRRPENSGETTKDGKWDFGDDDQDTNINMAADRFIQQERKKFGKTTKDWNRINRG